MAGYLKLLRGQSVTIRWRSTRFYYVQFNGSRDKKADAMSALF
ncbi:hypothetical protein LP43_2169 [Methylophaga thiooxydans]|uniref:Uncharacterized protein n=1 Tax=Methylophaga thiooxydans TaxID=392484 RepID=A0A0A0BEM5_9GAMM|nr:hypothetical protein LP43_2169 [Methylophaga thiooxydans]